MFRKLLDFLFPPTNHERIVASLDHLQPHPARVTTRTGVSVLTCASYDSPEIQSAIKVLKRHGSKHAAQLLSQLLHDTLLEEVSETHIWDSENVYIVPVPIHSRRKRKRGFNQMEVVLQELPISLQSLVLQGMLEQDRHTKMQKTLSREERLANVDGAFAVKNTEQVSGAHIFPVDDVVTTGATLASAAKTLEEAGAHVTCVALARA